MKNYREKLLVEASAFDGLMAFKFINMLIKPFKEWEAYEMGIIDEKGKLLKKPKTPSEKKEYSMFHRLVKNMKVLISKMPGGKGKIATLAGALFLLKEEYNLSNGTSAKMMDMVIESLSDLDTDVVIPENTSFPKVLDVGKYELDSGEIVIIRERMVQQVEFLGIRLYESDINTTGERLLFAVENIKRKLQ